MTRLGTASPPLPTRVRTAQVGLAFTVAVVVLLAALTISLSRGPSFVPRVTIDNPTVYRLQVDVGSPGESGGLNLGVLPRAGATTVEEVVDRGESWEFRFSYGGQTGGAVTVSRDQLDQEGWRLTVPLQVEERLREAGLPPSY